MLQASEGMRLKVVGWMTTKLCLDRVLEPKEAFPLMNFEQGEHEVWL